MPPREPPKEKMTPEEIKKADEERGFVRPEGYKSNATRCNESMEFRENYLKSLLEKKEWPIWEIITPEQLATEIPGQWFHYIDNNNNYRTGGLIVVHSPNAEGGLGFLKEQERLKSKQYIMYKTPLGNTTSLQLKEVTDCDCPDDSYHPHPFATKIYIRRHKSQYKKPTVPKKFNPRHAVFLKDEDGVEQIVYYNRDRMKRERFKTTHKYKIAVKYGWVFI